MTTLTINHEVRLSKSGSAMLVRRRNPVKEDVVAVYSPENGVQQVRTASGDVWAAVQRGTDYVTVSSV